LPAPVAMSDTGWTGKMTELQAHEKNTTRTVLVVEDEPEIRELIGLHLRRAGYQILMAGSVEQAENILSQHRVQCVLLDWMLPDSSGIHFARFLRSGEDLVDIPILMVTAKSEPQDIIEGLASGADDYLAKPFDTEVLIARVQALLRRYDWIQKNRKVQFSEASPFEKPDAENLSDKAGNSLESRASDVATKNTSTDAVNASGAEASRQFSSRVNNSAHSLASEDIFIGELRFNRATFQASCRGEPVQLTPSEFKLLTAMHRNQGRVLSRDALIAEVQGEGVSVIGRTIDTHVFGLRKKLGACADIIETIRGVGYRVKL
jgi:DNA-binding response OmpR family regulator